MILRDEYEIVIIKDSVWIKLEKFDSLKGNSTKKMLRISAQSHNKMLVVLHIKSKDLLKKNLEELNMLSLQKELEDWLDGKVSD